MSGSGLIALAKEKGVAGYPGDGANQWNAVHARDATSVFRSAWEKGLLARGRGRRHPVPRHAIGRRLGLPVVSIPPTS
ncbi:MAG TPA: hypothetical protein VGL02_24905 [Streptomyces sp.]